MDREIKIQKSFSRLIRYCLTWSYAIMLLGLVILSIIFAVLKAWSTILFVAVIPSVGLLIVFWIVYLIVKKKDKTYFVFTVDTIKKVKGENELFTIRSEDIDQITFHKTIPQMDIIELPSPTLVIKLKSKINNHDEFSVFTTLENAKAIQQGLNKEIIFKKN